MESKQVNVAMSVELFDAIKAWAHEHEESGNVVTVPEAIRRLLEEALINRGNRR